MGTSGHLTGSTGRTVSSAEAELTSKEGEDGAGGLVSTPRSKHSGVLSAISVRFASSEKHTPPKGHHGELRDTSFEEGGRTPERSSTTSKKLRKRILGGSV